MGAKSLAAITPLLPILPVERMWNRCAATWLMWRRAPRRGGPIVPLRVAQFLALVFIALALVPSGAHLFALPNKMDLARDQYFVVQNIYRGWALFGIVLFGALLQSRACAPTARQGHAVFSGAGCFLLHRAFAPGFLHLDLPGQSGDRQLDDHPGELGAIASAMGIFARRQCAGDVRGILLAHAVGADEAE